MARLTKKPAITMYCDRFGFVCSDLTRIPFGSFDLENFVGTQGLCRSYLSVVRTLASQRSNQAVLSPVLVGPSESWCPVAQEGPEEQDGAPVVNTGREWRYW